MVRRSRTILSSAAISVMLLVALRLASAATTLKEEDRNHDGKTDQWTWCDDQTTTYVTDTNYDGLPDVISAVPRDKSQARRIWYDRDRDGQYDDLRVEFPTNYRFHNRCYEQWRRIQGQPSDVEYFKRDEKARLLTWGKTSALGSKALDSVRTTVIREIEGDKRDRWKDYRKRDHWTDHRNGVSVFYNWESNGPRAATLWAIEVSLWADDWEAMLEYKDEKTTLPKEIEYREWEPPASDSVPPKLVIKVFDANNDQRFDRVSVWKDMDNTTESLAAKDTNRDGAYDEFYLRSNLLVLRTEKDSDFDGRLDWIEIHAADGTKTRLVGDQIPDRRLRVVPIPDEKIKGLLDRARTALVAGPPK